MQRREFMALLTGAALGPRVAFAQSSSKVYRLGTLNAVAPINEKSQNGATLLHVLEQRGYVLGKNLSLDARAAMSQVSKLPELVRAMKADKVYVIVTTGFRPHSPARWKMCRLSSRSAPAIQSPPTLSMGWRDRAATLRAFRTMQRRFLPNASI